ncbi:MULTISPECIES: amino acid permease [Brevundimonas]|uniref:amino acid permease n=1 Tax=Brevundimonas TaxID=41275 RepID=UPI000F01C7E6|nr:amino acid permease [Brevundimonas lutea]
MTTVGATTPNTAGRLGWGVAGLLVAGNMIGSGLYLLPATLAPFGSSSLIGWLVCGVGALVLALMFGALGRFRPGADGLIDQAEQGLGRFAGYLAALAYWMACLAGNVAVAIAGTGYLAFFFPVLEQPWPAAMANLGFIWVATLAYIFGARSAARLGAAALIVGLLPILIAVAAAGVAFRPQTFAASWSPEGLSLAQSVPPSLAIIFWAFLGLESAAVLSRQVRDPARDVGRATVAGVGLALVVYIAACVAVFGVIPAERLALSTSPYADLAARVFGASIAGLVAACAVIKVLGTVTGWTMMGGETARRAAEKGWAPRWFGGGGRGRPLSNPLINGGVMTVLALISVQPTLGEQFGVLVGVTSVLCLTLYALCAVGLWKASTEVRWRLLALAGLVFSVAAVVAASTGYVWPTLGFFTLCALAWLWVRRQAPPAVDPGPGPL